MRSQGSLREPHRRCHVLIDCDVKESSPCLEEIPIYCFKAKWDYDELYLLILELRAFR
jgi:hypothetical protein